VVARAGLDGINRLFESEAMLPTPSELDAPGLWLARIGVEIDEDAGGIPGLEIPDFPDFLRGLNPHGPGRHQLRSLRPGDELVNDRGSTKSAQQRGQGHYSHGELAGPCPATPVLRRELESGEVSHDLWATSEELESETQKNGQDEDKRAHSAPHRICQFDPCVCSGPDVDPYLRITRVDLAIFDAKGSVTADEIASSAGRSRVRLVAGGLRGAAYPDCGSGPCRPGHRFRCYCSTSQVKRESKTASAITEAEIDARIA
jgi:hypothetical protein